MKRASSHLCGGGPRGGCEHRGAPARGAGARDHLAHGSRCSTLSDPTWRRPSARSWARTRTRSAAECSTRQARGSTPRFGLFPRFKSAHTLVRTGAPGPSLVATAEEQDVGLPLVGARSSGLLERWFYGSTSSQVLRHGAVPGSWSSRMPRPLRTTRCSSPSTSCRRR
uniref:universal stress protein n=1 Tax=Georgenia sp. M64 TaxID=3120520 RepID=UPI00404ACFC5